MNLKSLCLRLVRTAIDAVNPKRLVEANLCLINENELLVANHIRLELDKNVYVVAFGKAVLPMCEAVDSLLRDNLVKGIAVLPQGTCIDSFDQTRIRLYLGAKNNLPDEDAFEAAQRVHQFCLSLKESDILIALVSGGGSALLPYPVDGISLDDKIATIKLLASSGATINDLNLVRICLSKLKGGGLAKCAFPAKVVALFISDVVDDPLEIIASGPTCVNFLQDSLKFNKAIDILKRFNVYEKVPNFVRDYLLGQIESKQESYESFDVSNFIIGNNKIALIAIENELTSNNVFKTIFLTSSLQGEAKQFGKMFALLASYLVTKEINEDLIKHYLDDSRDVSILKNFIEKCRVVRDDKRVAILSGGETTVNLFDGQLTPQSLGGRNQELVLSFKKTLKELFEQNDAQIFSHTRICFTSFGTDGIDGPTDAAGAIVETPFEDENDDFLVKCLHEHNSYAYFKQQNDLIKIGHTGTNVADIQILLVEKF